MSGKILIADGNSTSRILLKVKLASACYDSILAGTATETVRLARLMRPDLIIIDAGLPDCPADELCLRLREDPETVAMPIIVIADRPARIAMLRAGAAEVMSRPIDEMILMARIRCILRDRADETVEPVHLGTSAEVEGMAEAAVGFAHAVRDGTVTMVAASPSQSLGWRHALQAHLNARMTVCDAESVLSQAARGNVPDLYVIAADLDRRGDGLRLMSELRARRGSRDAGFLVALRDDQLDLSAIALDLGAGDVMPVQLSGAELASETALRIRAQIQRKRAIDRRRRENETVRILAVTDPLTGLFNRRHAIPALHRMIDDMAADCAGIGVLTIDIDHFKQVNDTHGHAAGDEVLRCVAERLRHALRQGDLLARIGGEEFLVALPDVDRAQAGALAERLRDCVSFDPVRLPGLRELVSVPVTISIGLDFVAPDCGESLPEGASRAEIAMAASDRALMAAKNEGRNRVCRSYASSDSCPRPSESALHAAGPLGFFRSVRAC